MSCATLPASNNSWNICYGVLFSVFNEESWVVATRVLGNNQEKRKKKPMTSLFKNTDKKVKKKYKDNTKAFCVNENAKIKMAIAKFFGLQENAIICLRLFMKNSFLQFVDLH